LRTKLFCYLRTVEQLGQLNSERYLRLKTKFHTMNSAVAATARRRQWELMTLSILLRRVNGPGDFTVPLLFRRRRRTFPFRETAARCWANCANSDVFRSKFRFAARRTRGREISPSRRFPRFRRNRRCEWTGGTWFRYKIRYRRLTGSPTLPPRRSLRPGYWWSMIHLHETRTEFTIIMNLFFIRDWHRIMQHATDSTLVIESARSTTMKGM
jgi:hypothetical protein